MIDLEIKEKKNCTGCYACENICPVSCISMDSDIEGFWYPKVEYDKCIKCGKCIDVCPIINKKTVKNYPKAYACFNKDESIRLRSSSGGVFTLLAENIITDGGVVFGAGFNEEFDVEHSCAETKEELEKFRGSKYVQSKIGNTFEQARDFLNSGRKVLFTGTPCQIGGLRSYLYRHYENLLCVDIICHGVPSPSVWKKYVKYRERRAGSATQKISFRRKDKGWKRYSISFSFKNNTEYLKTLDKDLYMKAFLKDVCLRPSCYACEFKTLHRQSDITLADFWGVQRILYKMDDDKGTSLIFENSMAGQVMLEQIKDNLEWQEVDMNGAVKYNPAAIESVKYNPKREIFMKKKDNKAFDILVRMCYDEKLLIRVKRRVKLAVRIILEKVGLLHFVNNISSKFNKI